MRLCCAPCRSMWLKPLPDIRQIPGRLRPRRCTGEDLISALTGQHHDGYSANDRADHAIPALAQRGAKMGLTNQSCGRSCPIRIVELKPERDVKRETDRT